LKNDGVKRHRLRKWCFTVELALLNVGEVTRHFLKLRMTTKAATLHAVNMDRLQICRDFDRELIRDHCLVSTTPAKVRRPERENQDAAEGKGSAAVRKSRVFRLVRKFKTLEKPVLVLSLLLKALHAVHLKT